MSNNLNEIPPKNTNNLTSSQSEPPKPPEVSSREQVVRIIIMTVFYFLVVCAPAYLICEKSGDLTGFHILCALGFIVPIFSIINITSNNNENQDVKKTSDKDMFSEIPLEVFELLYIIDGKHKNFSPNDLKSKSQYYEISATARVFLENSEDEPSAIYTNMAISKNPSEEKPPYFPRYSLLSAGQRRAYFNFLTDPLSGKHDVGYVFLFYYGLERHLLTGKTEKAFEMILKLRKAYPNKSFLRYSANALWGTCVLKEQSDLALKFVSEIDDYTQLIDYRLFALFKFKMGIPILAEEIVAYAKDIGFENMPYIKRHKEDFIRETETLMENKFGNKFLVFDTTGVECTKSYDLNMFVNQSLFGKTVSVPDYSYIVSDVLINILSEAYVNIRGHVPVRKTNPPPVKSRFDMDKMIKLNPNEEIYAFPPEYYSIVKDDIFSMNKIIEEAEQLCNILIPEHIEKRSIRVVKPESSNKSLSEIADELVAWVNGAENKTLDKIAARDYVENGELNGYTCSDFSVLEYTPLTPTGKNKKFPQCVHFYVYDNVECKSSWSGHIFYDQKGEIGKGLLNYHLKDNRDRHLSYNITFKENGNIKKVTTLLPGKVEIVQLYP